MTLQPYLLRELILQLSYYKLDTFPAYELFLYKVFALGEVLIDYAYLTLLCLQHSCD